MDFSYTSEQQMLRNCVREFADAELAPHSAAWDDGQDVPRETLRRLGRQGYLGAIFPESLGGAGMNYIDYCILIEELSRVDGAIGLIVAAHTSLCANHIFLIGSTSQRETYLPRLASGDAIGCWCLSEPDAGSDAASLQTTAQRTRDGWTLNGVKTFATNAHIADVYVIMAATAARGARHRISAFIVERGADRLRLGRKEQKMGLRASTTGQVLFDACALPSGQLLGAENAGFADCMRVLDGGRVSIAALSIGMAQGAYEAALRYAKTRKQFGQPIAEFQMIQHKLADMAVSLDAARLLTQRAAWLIDHKQDATQASATAKLFSSEVAVQIANDALQIHGGYGYLKDYGVEKIYRDVRLCTLGEGTSEIQRLVIARRILAAGPERSTRTDLPATCRNLAHANH